jgi:tripartite-type tricarboxylate transporter receptor subunit TctC
VLFTTATGIAAPKGTPPEIVKALETSMAKLAATEDYKKALLGNGITPTFSGAREYEQFWVKYDEDVGPVVKALLQ